MVKSLLETREEQALAEFAREAEMFGKLAPHAAVARLVTVMTETEPHLMVMEYSDWVSDDGRYGWRQWDGEWREEIWLVVALRGA